MFEDTVPDVVARNSLQQMDVCIFHFNSFCFDFDIGRHYPAEIAIAKFNLSDGVWDVLHALCNPGPLRMDYADRIQAKSARTHRLLPPPGPSNLGEIFDNIVTFVGEIGKPPPLYVPPQNFQEAKEFLTELCIDFGRNPQYLEAYPLTELFLQMRNGAAGNAVLTPSNSKFELEQDTYEFAPKIACEFHEQIGIPNQCSKSFVTRMAYIICALCCNDLNITLIPGKHVPQYTPELTRGISPASSEADGEMYQQQKRILDSSFSLSDDTSSIGEMSGYDGDASSTSTGNIIKKKKKKNKQVRFADTDTLHIIGSASSSLARRSIYFDSPGSSQESGTSYDRSDVGDDDYDGKQTSRKKRH